MIGALLRGLPIVRAKDGTAEFVEKINLRFNLFGDTTQIVFLVTIWRLNYLFTYPDLFGSLIVPT